MISLFAAGRFVYTVKKYFWAGLTFTLTGVTIRLKRLV
jgi:hypothetical protein